MTAPQPPGPAQLARQLGMSTGSVNALVNRRQARGRLSRRRCPEDHRRVLLSVSPAIHAAVTQTLRPLGQSIDRLGEAMSDHDVPVVVDFLEETANVHQQHFGQAEASRP